jgi:hypothetical protein
LVVVILFTKPNEMIPVILIQQKKYIRQFEKLAATSSDSAIVPEEYGIRKSLAFNKLLRQQIITKGDDGRYYLQKLRADEHRKKRREILIILLIVIISALLLLAIAVDYFSRDRLLHMGG